MNLLLRTRFTPCETRSIVIQPWDEIMPQLDSTPVTAAFTTTFIKPQRGDKCCSALSCCTKFYRDEYKLAPYFIHRCSMSLWMNLSFVLQVALIDLNKTCGEECKTQLDAEFGAGNCTFIQCDVSNGDALRGNTACRTVIRAITDTCAFYTPYYLLSDTIWKLQR